MVTSDFQLSPGEMVGEYRVVRKIGEGAFGKVYAAVHPVIGKPAAIKVLNPAFSSNPEMVTRFADEARAVNQIRHRNIIDIFAFGSMPNGLSYFVMELLEGMTFHAYLRQNGPLDPATALAILWPVGRALAAAHKAGIAHRDLKPDNVFLSMDQEGGMFPKLLDFGIAKLMAEGEMAQRTRTGMLLGTPVYMSPEQCRGTQVDHRADIYSFGIMTHEALTGKRPFDADNVMDVIMRQLSDPPPKMSTCRPGLSPALDLPVLRMLEKLAAKRPQTMLAALDELSEAARSSGVVVPASMPGSAVPSVPQPSAMPGMPGGQAQSSMAGPGGPSHVVDTGAWLQHQQGPQGSMGGPAMSGTVPAMSAAAPAMSAAVPAMSAAVPSLSLAVPSGGAPHLGSMAQPGPGSHSPSASYGMPSPQLSMGYPQPPMSGPQLSMGYPQPPMSGPQAGGGYGPPPGQGDAATMMSAGMREPSASMPGSAPMSMSGPASMAGPASYGGGAAPAAAKKSHLGLFLGLGGGVLLLILLVVGGLAMSGGSGSGSASGAAASAVGDKPGTVQIGSKPPTTGAVLEQSGDGTIQMELLRSGATTPTATVLIRTHSQLKLTVLAVNDWHVTRAEVSYSDHSIVTKMGQQPEKTELNPTANKAYFVASQDSGLAVSAVGGTPVTEEARNEVRSNVGQLFKPRPEVFRRPLAIGESVSPPSPIVIEMLDLAADEPTTVVRAENAVFRLKAIDQAAKRAIFDVEFSYTNEAKKPSVLTLSSPLKGTIAFDITTGEPMSGDLAGPLTGALTESGVKFTIKGSMKLVAQTTRTP